MVILIVSELHLSLHQHFSFYSYVLFLKNSKKFFQTCERTEMCGAERDECLQFLVEPRLSEPEFTDVWNNHNTPRKTLDQMCWIYELFSWNQSVLEVLSLRHNKEDLD